MAQHSPFVAALSHLATLGGELIESSMGLELPPGDRIDKLVDVVSRIQQALTEAQAAFDTELPFLPKAGHQ